MNKDESIRFKEEHEFADLVGIRYLLSRGGEENDPFDKSGYRLLKKFGHIEVYENEDAVSLGRFYTDAVSREEFDQYLKANGKQKAQDLILERLVLDGVSSKNSALDNAVASSAAVSIEAPVKDDHLQGVVDAPADGYVFFAIPFEKGWKIYVDGEKQEILRANLGFQGIAVTEGVHRVELVYQAPGFYLGTSIIRRSPLAL